MDRERGLGERVGMGVYEFGGGGERGGSEREDEAGGREGEINRYKHFLL